MTRSFVCLAIASAAACGDPIPDATLSIEVTLESVSPTKIPAGERVELTLTGRNLDRVETIFVDGVATAPIQHLGPTLLRVAAPVLPPGTKTIEAVTRNARVVMPDAVRYFATKVSFVSPSLLVREAHAEQIRAGDADGDGKVDLVVRSAAGVSKWIQHETGWIRSEVHSDPDERLVELADLDGDRRADLITTHGVRRGIDGQLELIAGPDRILRADAADIDGDQRVELVFTHCRQNCSTTPHYSALRFDVNEGDESIFRDRLFEAATVGDPREHTLRLADLDGNGSSELIHLKMRPQNTWPDTHEFVVWSGPTLTSSAAIGGATLPSVHFAVANIFGADPDLVTSTNVLINPRGRDTGWTSQSMARLCGEGAPRSIDGFSNTRGVAIIAHCLNGTAWVERWDESGQPLLVATHAAGDFELEVADVDGDLADDVLYADEDGIHARWGSPLVAGELLADRGAPVAEYGVTTSCEAPNTLVELARGTFGGGAILAATFELSIALFAPRIEGEELTLAPISRFTVLEPIVDVAACDFDGDAIDDLVVTDGQQLHVLRVHPDGALEYRERLRLPEVTPGFVTEPQLITGDFDADGRCDVAVLDDLARDAAIAFNRPHELELRTIAVRASKSSVRARDVDGDGAAELYGVRAWDLLESPLLWRNDGHGRFEETNMEIVDAPSGLYAVDVLMLDDGATWVAFRGETVQVAGVRGGKRVAYDPIPIMADELSLRAGELDGDGEQDLLLVPATDVTHVDGLSAEILFARQLESRQTISLLDASMLLPRCAHRWGDIELVDLDRDGLDDIVSTPFALTGDVSVRKNIGE